jgi:hypothetical protein
MNSIYLARGKKLFGPLTEAEWTEMQASGRDEDYHWIWKGVETGWQVLHSAPVAPPLPDNVIPIERARRAAETRGPRFHFPKGVEILAHDYRHVIVVTFDDVSERGALLNPTQSHEPLFSIGGPIILNLLDPDTGKSVNLRAEVAAIRRENAGLTYELRWNWADELAPALKSW